MRFRGLPSLVVGPGTMIHLAQELTGKVLLVSDQGVKDAGLVEVVSRSLPNHDLEIHTELSAEPTSEIVDRLARKVREDAPDWVIGLGGGSALDLVKLSCCVAAAEPSSEHYALSHHALPCSPARRVLIPTTAGTGAEVTRTAIFTDSHKRKTWAWGEHLGCDLVVLDGELCRALPPLNTRLCGLDCIAHALESLISPKATSFTRAFSFQALELAGAFFPRVLADPDDVEARQGMLEASLVAGISIDLCGTGIGHAGAHAASTLVGIGHGAAVAWAMKTAIAWNGKAVPELYEVAAQKLLPGSSDMAFVWSEMLQLCGSLPQPQTLSDSALAAALLAPENETMLYNNPRPVGTSDVRRLSLHLLGAL